MLSGHPKNFFPIYRQSLLSLFYERSVHQGRIVGRSGDMVLPGLAGDLTIASPKSAGKIGDCVCHGLRQASLGAPVYQDA